MDRLRILVWTLTVAGIWSVASCSSNGKAVGHAAGNYDAGGMLDAGGGVSDTGTTVDAAGGILAGGASGHSSEDAGSTGGTGGTAEPLGPHCAGLPATCGPQHNENCCTSPTVPGGTFYRGYDGSSPYTKMDYPATVSTFALDKYEVTVARYRPFGMSQKGTRFEPPADGAGEHPLIPGSGWNPIWNMELPYQPMDHGCTGGTWTTTVGPNEDLPMNCISWYEAFAFCIWDGGRLPTEAEWNYAAAGGSEQRKYPWGSPEPDASRAVFGCVADAGQDCAPTAFLPAGSKPDGNGKYGHADLAGSVWEWVFDQYGDYPVPCSDCAAMSSDKIPHPAIRGGSYESSAYELRTAAERSDRWAFSTTTDLGFRCARAAP